MPVAFLILHQPSSNFKHICADSSSKPKHTNKSHSACWYPPSWGILPGAFSHITEAYSSWHNPAQNAAKWVQPHQALATGGRRWQAASGTAVMATNLSGRHSACFQKTLVGGALTSPTATPTARLMWVFLSFLPHLLYHLTLAAWEHFPNTLPRPGPSMTLLSTDSKSRSFVETILGNKQRKRLSFLPEPLQSGEDQ